MILDTFLFRLLLYYYNNNALHLSGDEIGCWTIYIPGFAFLYLQFHPSSKTPSFVSYDTLYIIQYLPLTIQIILIVATYKIVILVSLSSISDMSNVYVNTSPTPRVTRYSPVMFHRLTRSTFGTRCHLCFKLWLMELSLIIT